MFWEGFSSQIKRNRHVRKKPSSFLLAFAKTLLWEDILVGIVTAVLKPWRKSHEPYAEANIGKLLSHFHALHVKAL